MKVDLKGFLRKHGFRHLSESDRGAIWGNGVEKVFIQKHYDGQAAQLRNVMDTIRKGDRQKQMRELSDERKLHDQVEKLSKRLAESPEEHRIEQIEHAKKMQEGEEKFVPIPASTPKPIAPEPQVINFRGTKEGEKVYVLGRVKAMLKKDLEDEEVASALHLELATKPDGSPIDEAFVYNLRTHWSLHPLAYSRVTAVLEPLDPQSAEAPVVEAPPEPVMKMELPPPAGKLPRIVMSILTDEDTPAEKKVQMILAWAEGE